LFIRKRKLINKKKIQNHQETETNIKNIDSKEKINNNDVTDL
jgi:hypothetical protein